MRPSWPGSVTKTKSGTKGVSAASYAEGFRVRRASPPDVPIIVGFNCAMAKETEGIALAPDIVQAGVLSAIEDASKGFYLLVEPIFPAKPVDLVGSLFAEDGTITVQGSDTNPSYPPLGQAAKPVGQLLITYEWSDWRCGDFWWIQSVYVDPEWRGRGAFRALFDHVKAESEKRVDVAGLRLYAVVGNGKAHDIYARLGMKGGRYVIFEIDRKGGGG